MPKTKKQPTRTKKQPTEKEMLEISRALEHGYGALKWFYDRYNYNNKDRLALHPTVNEQINAEAFIELYEQLRSKGVV